MALVTPTYQQRRCRVSAARFSVLRTLTPSSVVAYQCVWYAEADFALLERTARLADSSAGVQPQINAVTALERSLQLQLSLAWATIMLVWIE